VADLSGPFAGASERGLEETRSIASDEGLRQKGVLAAVGPHATDSVSDPLFQKCAELAAQMQLPVHLHVAQSFAELTRGHGVSALTERLLEHLRELPLLFAHGLFLHDESLQALAKRGAVLAYCPLSQLQFGFLAPLLAYIEAGGAVTIGTDCVASNDAHSVQRELAWLSGAAVQNVSFGSRRAGYLKSGSLQVAREVEQERANSAVSEATEPSFLSRVAFGGTLTILDGRPRGIEVGADANFQVLDACAPELFPCEDLARRLTFGDTKAALKTLVVRGRPIGEPGLFRRSLVESELYRETLAEALRRRDELLARAKVT
jgi:cytosine/adenosine deaminase-related metal-dependent hydrolase